jgi:hypothetical protein
MPIWPAESNDTAAYPFNPQETERLHVYRAAVAAGFYTDSLAPYRVKVDTKHARRRERALRGTN